MVYRSKKESKIKKAIVITTINEPTEAVKKFSKLNDFRLYIAGDNKGPKQWNLPDCIFLSIKKQNSRFPKLSQMVAQNHYARKNLAYLAAIKDNVQYLYESDDDNIPFDFFPRFSHKSIKLTSFANKQACNVYSIFSKDPIWPRGLPLKKINDRLFIKTKRTIKPFIQQSLADIDPDVDAIYRLINGKMVTFKKNIKVSISKGTFCPFNSQNTYWHKMVFSLLYLPSTVESRVTDIWRGYIAQRILWEFDSEVIFSSPSVYQDRNKHDLLRDFKEEIELYTKVDDLLEALENLKLNGGIDDMLLHTYQVLISKSFFQPKEIKIVREWLKEINSYSPS